MKNATKEINPGEVETSGKRSYFRCSGHRRCHPVTKGREGKEREEEGDRRGRGKREKRDSFILNFSRIPKEQQYKWKMRTDLN
jgi:hypothetical protein